MKLLTSMLFLSGFFSQDVNHLFGTHSVPGAPGDTDFNLALRVWLSHLEQNFELPLERWEEGSAWTCVTWRVPEGLGEWGKARTALTSVAQLVGHRPPNKKAAG